MIRDEAAEAKYHMKLGEALERAKTLKGTLFKDQTFYVTPKTRVDFKLLKNVVHAHSGNVSLSSLLNTLINYDIFKARTTVTNTSAAERSP
jgi:hypothetical protein